MTAVAQQPSFLPGPRAPWNGNGPTNGNINSVTDEVARIFVKRSSSVSSSSSSSSSPSAPSEGSNGGWGTSVNGKKKGVNRATARGSNGQWPSKSDIMRVPAGSNPHGNSLSGSSSSLNGNHQPMPILPSQHLMSVQTQNGGQLPPSYLMLLPLNGTFDRKLIPLPYYPETLRIGRQTNAKTLPTQVNGYFDSKVLSRQHAEVWAEKLNGSVWIRDIKSSNGTFVNGQRLSQENRDSEPHELRAEDVLELGIDIVGDDNKTIIHHKVAARVEHAGLQTPNIGNFDLNFADINTMNGTPVASHNGSAPHQNGSIRGRSGSQGSRSSLVNGGGISHRQPPLMLQPVTVEMVVKKLNYEIQAAKQQYRDLRRTSEIFDDMLSPRAVVDAVQNNPAPSVPVPPIPVRAESVPPSNSHFQQHLRLHHVPESRRPPPPGKIRFENPTKTDRLAAVCRELEAKNVRVKDLEEALERERSAREIAEGRAAQLEDVSRAMMATSLEMPLKEFDVEKIQADESTTQTDEIHDMRSEKMLDGQPEVPEEEERDLGNDDDTLNVKIDPSAQAAAEAANRLQRRVEDLIAELKSAKEEIDRYKRRAKDAEDDEVKSRKTLGEMVEKIRREEQARKLREKEAASQTETVLVKNTGIQVESTGSDEAYEFLQNGTVKPTPGKVAASKHTKTIGPTINRGDKEGTLAITKRDAAPYASILGVMLIGVGLMAVLNRWHKVES